MINSCKTRLISVSIATVAAILAWTTLGHAQRGNTAKGAQGEVAVAAGVVDEGFAGDQVSTGPITPPPDKVEFDDSERYVPPNELPIEDVYIKEAVTLSTEQAADELTAVAITPEGKIEVLPADAAAVRAVVEAARVMEATEELSIDGAKAPEPTDTTDNESSEAFEKGSVQAESVIGSDTRVRITATTKYPFRTMGRIDIGCTGTLIGPRHVLTAGHCVYNIRTDKWYSKLNFTPGQNGSVKPWGTIGWKRAISVKGWTQNHKRNYDYAMIVLNKDIGKTVGWMGYGWKQPLPKYNVNINGYPGDKPFGTMWHAFCKLNIITTYRLYYPCDTFGGMSGSAVYVYWKNTNKRTIYGIHAYGVDSTGLNGATRIRKAVFENLKKWKSTY